MVVTFFASARKDGLTLEIDGFVHDTPHFAAKNGLMCRQDQFEEDYMVTPHKWSTIGKTLGLEKRQHFKTSQTVTMNT